VNGSGEGGRRKINRARTPDHHHVVRRAATRLTEGTLVTLLVLTAAGCGGAEGGDAPGLPVSRPSIETTSPQTDPGSGGPTSAGESRGTEESGGAKGAPIQIPARIQDQGRPLAEVTAEIEAGVREQCGGTLCVDLRHEQRDQDPFTQCDFIQTEPQQRTLVARGSTVVIVSGAAPCESESPSPSGSESGSPPTEGPEVPAETSPVLPESSPTL
jgi:hypothetical protein